MAQWQAVIGPTLLTLLLTTSITSGLDNAQDQADTDAVANKDKKYWSGSDSDPLSQDGDSLNSLQKTLAQELDNRKWEDSVHPLLGAGVVPMEKDKRKWSNSMRVWGKRSQPGEPATEEDKRAWDKTMRVWGKRSGGWDKNDLLADGKDTDAEKQLGKMLAAAGHKPSSPQEDNDVLDAAKRKWSKTMRVWGKRDQADMPPEVSEDIKRKWSNTMRVWGKRGGLDGDMSADPLEEEKRAWDTTMRVWGKRSGSSSDPEIADEDADIDTDAKRTWQGNTMRVWGKRNHGQQQLASPDQPEDPAEKKAWDKTMRVWGKRDIHKRSIDLDQALGLRDIADKRAWNTGSMRVWGKRYNRDNEGGPKRSWKTNVMRVWGKRNWDPVQAGNSLENSKRGWNSASRTWGKRATGLTEDELDDILSRYI